jgi:hypothetical protein
LTTKDLASFLSDDWLNDEMMNAGTDFITRQLGHESRARVVNVRSRHHTYRTKHPHPLDQLITEGRVDILYLPVHVNGNHWTLILSVININTVIRLPLRHVFLWTCSIFLSGG